MKSDVFVLVGKPVKILVLCRLGATDSLLETLRRLLNLRHLQLGCAFVVQVKVLLLVVASKLFLAFIKLVEDVKSAVSEFLECVGTVGTFGILSIFYTDVGSLGVGGCHDW